MGDRTCAGPSLLTLPDRTVGYGISTCFNRSREMDYNFSLFAFIKLTFPKLQCILVAPSTKMRNYIFPSIPVE
jgi:hypothetical protein